MENYRPQIGTSVCELETPCLLLDVDALEHNYQVIADTYRDTECKMRTHTKNLKSPLLAHMQIRAGGTVGGVCTAKVAEADCSNVNVYDYIRAVRNGKLEAVLDISARGRYR